MQVKNRQSNKQRLNNANYMLWSKSAVVALSLRKMWHAHARLLYAGMLTVPVMLLTGCAHNQTPPCKAPEAVMMPALSQALPPQSYSISAANDIRSWGLRLTDTPATLKR